PLFFPAGLTLLVDLRLDTRQPGQPGKAVGATGRYAPSSSGRTSPTSSGPTRDGRSRGTARA
ncbi:hypothetical protein, partial [Escherichia coli]|uniref:hypothetical protein n=1 Tax=Escherichia coli TaxID=562 RepID=UPI003D36238F